MEDNRIIALDIGTKRTGVAVSDPQGIFAFPLAQFEASHRKEWMEELLKVLEDYEIGCFLVGMPFDAEGGRGPAAKKIAPYIAMLQERFKVPVIEWDERYTTVEAERTLLDADVSRRKRKTVIDKLAATVLLKSYLEHGKPLQS